MYDVIIIGGGVSGIITSKYLAENGLGHHVVLESRHSFGGVWLYSDDGQTTTVVKQS